MQQHESSCLILNPKATEGAGEGCSNIHNAIISIKSQSSLLLKNYFPTAKSWWKSADAINCKLHLWEPFLHRRVYYRTRNLHVASIHQVVCLATLHSITDEMPFFIFLSWKRNAAEKVSRASFDMIQPGNTSVGDATWGFCLKACFELSKWRESLFNSDGKKRWEMHFTWLLQRCLI